MTGGRRSAGGLAILVVLATAVGCATVFRPFPTSRVTIHSDPPGARVMVDGEEVGVTPVVTPLSPNRAAYRLRLEKDGCVPSEHELRRSTSSGWATASVLGGTAMGMGAAQEGGIEALVLAPAILIAADWFTGAMFRLPRTVRVPLRADVRGGLAAGTPGECGTGIAATAGRVSIPLSVPYEVHRNPLAPPGRLAADAGLRARLRALKHGSPGPPIGARPDGP